jgi:membrane protease YdiL (CAAX protease family)
MLNKENILRENLRYIIAVCIGILPLNIAMIWYRLTTSVEFTLSDMLVYPLLIGGGSIFLILALNNYFLKQGIGDFNPGKGKWYFDILIGMGLTVIYFILILIERATIINLLPQSSPPSGEIIDLMTSLAKNPLLLVIWLGPVVWIGVAVFEEVQRVFFMNCLWKLSENRFWQMFVIFFVAIFWGVMHLYQGTFGIISVSIQGLIMGIFYYKYRRIWPLIISHALYDSIQILMFVIQVS